MALPEIKDAFSEINKIALHGLKHSQIEELTETITKIKSNITENIHSI
jgi:hypothetical protein